MKKLLFFLSLVLVFNCSKDDDSDDNRNTRAKVLNEIIMSTSKDTLIANTIDKAVLSYTFKDQNGTSFNFAESDSIKNLMELRVNGMTAQNKTEIISQASGMNFILNASVGNINSNTITIPSYDVQIELISSNNIVYANGKASITFERNFVTNENISIDESQLTLEYENGILYDYAFSTENQGSYNFILKSGSIESNEVTVDALQVDELNQEILIPLVFHIVPLEQTLEGDIGNPTDERIQQGVDMLNSVFSSSLYTSILEPRIVNDVTDNELAAGNISFYLADNPDFDSPGIIRYDDVPTTNNFSELTSFVETNILDTYEYINIFLFPLSGYGSGFSSNFPGTTADAQIPGLSIVDESWKPNEYIFMWPNIHPNGDLAFNLGNLLSHEVGHYLGLYHVFKGNLNNLPPNSCNNFDSDYVADTYEYDRLNHLSIPTSGESITSRLSCDGILEEGNNVMDYYFANWYPGVNTPNYSYSIMFTHQQMARMYNVLNTSPVRKQLAGLATRGANTTASQNISREEIIH